MLYYGLKSSVTETNELTELSETELRNVTKPELRHQVDWDDTVARFPDSN